MQPLCKLIKGGVEIIQNISVLAMLIPNCILDLKYKKVTMLLILPFMLEGIILNVLGLIDFKSSLIGVLCGLIVLVISVVTKGAIGKGDAYIICAMGCLIGGYYTIVVLTIAMFLSAIVGVVLVMFFRWKTKSRIPFVPFLLLSLVLLLIGG